MATFPCKRNVNPIKKVIAYLQGKIAQVEPTFAIIDCGGIGYYVRISLNTYSQIKDESSTKLFTYFQVREDAQILYGFSNPQEQQLFEQLISISGVGGNTAMMILSSISPEDLLTAIRTEDAYALKQVKGIGAKTAGRIILELKDKITLDPGLSDNSGGSPIQTGSKKQEALVALTSLGMPKAVMAKRIDRILKEEGNEVSVEQIIKLALRNA